MAEKEKKQRRRGKGEGTIYQRPDGTWTAQVFVGYDPLTGKPKRKTIYGKERKEVANKLKKILYEVEEKTHIDPSSETVETLFKNWLELKKPHINKNTYVNYECYINNHIIPLIGKVRLKDLTSDKLQRFINKLMENNLTAGTIKIVFVVLKMGLKKACREKKLSYDVIDREALELPRQKKSSLETLTKEELSTLLGSLEVLPNPAKGFLSYQQYKDRTVFAALLIESVSGLRRGELLGLKWSDINFDKGILNISRQWTQWSKFSNPKTDSSIRAIAITSDIVEFLKWFKDQQDEIKEKLGSEFDDNGVVFCYQKGKPIPHSTFFQWWARTLKKSTVKHIRFHDLRHTFVTLGLEDGIDYKMLQSMTGHKSIKTFFDVYGHVTKAMQETAAAKIGERVNNVIPFKKASSS
jgi:integrase